MAEEVTAGELSIFFKCNRFNLLDCFSDWFWCFPLLTVMLVVVATGVVALVVEATVEAAG